MSRLIGSLALIYVYDHFFQPGLSRHHLQLNITGQALPVMKFRVLYSAIVRNSERSEENWSPYKLVK